MTGIGSLEEAHAEKLARHRILTPTTSRLDASDFMGDVTATSDYKLARDKKRGSCRTSEKRANLKAFPA